jgi:hypothetical protein
MPVNIYVHLRDGTDILLKDVTATPTTVHLVRVSDPYRDLGHRGRNELSSDLGLDVAKLDNSASDVGHYFSPGNANIATVSTAIKTGVANGTSNDWGPAVSVPDNVSHIPPRQVDLLVSHYYFLTSSGINSYIPCEDVITWSENPRQ